MVLPTAADVDAAAQRLKGVALRTPLVTSPVLDALSTFGGNLLQIVPQSPETDIEPLADKGVPVFGIWQNGLTYFTYHHSAADTLDKVVPEQLRETAACLAVMGYALAEMSEPLER